MAKSKFKSISSYDFNGHKLIITYKKQSTGTISKFNARTEKVSKIKESFELAKINFKNDALNLPSNIKYKIKDKRFARKQSKKIKHNNSLLVRAKLRGKNIAHKPKSATTKAYHKGKNIIKKTPGTSKKVTPKIKKLGKNSKNIPFNAKNKIKKTTNRIKNAPANLKKKVKSLNNNIKNIPKNVKNKINNVANNIKGKIKNTANNIKNLPKNIKNKVKDSKRAIKTKINNTLPMKAYHKGRDICNKAKVTGSKIKRGAQNIKSGKTKENIKNGLKKYNPKEVAGRTKNKYNEFKNKLNAKDKNGKANRLKNLSKMAKDSKLGKKISGGINSLGNKIKNSNIFKKAEKIIQFIIKFKWVILITTGLILIAYWVVPAGFAIAQGFGSTSHYYCDMSADPKVLSSEIYQRYCGSPGLSNDSIASAALAFAYDNNNKGATENVWIRHSDGKSSNLQFLSTKVYAMVHDNINPGASYADCGKCAATAVLWAGADDNYPHSGTGGQLSYLQKQVKTTHKWELVGTTETPALLQPGDVLLVGPSTGGNFEYGHTAIYVGNEKVQERFPGTTYDVVSGALRSHTPKLVHLEGEYTGRSKHGYYFIFRNIVPDADSECAKYNPNTDPNGCKWPSA